MLRKTMLYCAACLLAGFAAAACDDGGNGDGTDAADDQPGDTVTEGDAELPPDDVPADTPDDTTPDTPVDTPADTPADTPTDSPGDTLPGGPCTCDSDCLDVGGQEGICVLGVCMILATGTCSAAGSTAECPEHLRCWGLSSFEGSAICWPDCDFYTSCAGECDGDGSCAPTSGMNCDEECGTYCSGGSTGDGEIGDACATDDDCADMGAMCYPEYYFGDPTGFVGGYCMIYECPTPDAACGTNGKCIANLGGSGVHICMRDCDAGCDREGYSCGSSGYCSPHCGSSDDCPGDYVCNAESFCGECVETECGGEEVCYRYRCIPDIGGGPGTYPGISCDLPELECTGGCDDPEHDCDDLIQFNPTNNPSEGGYDPMLGYIDYPENGETWGNQYRSWLRCDNIMMNKYATAKVACLAAEWDTGNGEPLGLIDMSEENGDIPGTSISDPAHPAGTHTDGRDIDVAYYQDGTDNNEARIICPYADYHCTDWPTILDAWRTALFLGSLFENPNVRVIGCDGKAGPLLDYAMDILCRDNWLTSYACANRALTYEDTNVGAGWYYFHLHHMHISYSPPTYHGPDHGIGEIDRQCMIPGCPPRPYEQYLATFGL